MTAVFPVLTPVPLVWCCPDCGVPRPNPETLRVHRWIVHDIHTGDNA